MSEISPRRTARILCLQLRRDRSKSRTNARNSASRSSARRIDGGWTVAITTGARADWTSSPRCCVTRNCRPRSACAAVAPRHTRTRGFTTASSASSHGEQAAISDQFGFWWIRRLPWPFHLKCLTTFVTYERPVDAGFLERLVEELAGGADERPPPCPPGRRAAHRRTSPRTAASPSRRPSAFRSSRADTPCSRPRTPQPSGRARRYAAPRSRRAGSAEPSRLRIPEAPIPFGSPAPWPSG